MKVAARFQLLLAAGLLWLGALLSASTVFAAAGQLSAYWPDAISRWEALIVEHASNNGFDPNLIAALIEEESKGNPRLVSRAGAVGLMQIMPYEAGFTWRPRAARLKDPAVNVEWGTNTFSQVVRQAQGRVSLALLAYNSGWDRIDLRSTRLFAARVLDHYARAIVTDRGLDPADLDDYQIIIVAHNSAGRVSVDRVTSGGAFEPQPAFDLNTIDPGWPHAVAYATIDGERIAWWVDVYVAASR